MTEETPEATASDTANVHQLVDDDGVPLDNPDGQLYAVYDTQLMRYVGPVTEAKPTAKEAKALAPNGHKVIKV